jgi:hypothetical protein
VLRIGADGYPHQVLFSLMHEAGLAPHGAPTSVGTSVSRVI